MKYKITNNKNSEMRVRIELSKDDLNEYVREAEKRLSADVKIKGFRAGKAPHELAKENIDKNALAQEAFDKAVYGSFAEFVQKEKFDIIDTSDLSIEKNSEDGLVYSITVVCYPEVKLGEYRDISVEKKKMAVQEKEVDDLMRELYESRKKGDDERMDDAFAQRLGNFKSLDELRENVKKNIELEKENKERGRMRTELLKAVAENTHVDIPPTLIERQLDSMLQDFDHMLHRNNMELSVYLAGQNKTQDDLRKEWKEKAEEQVKVSLIIRTIAQKERITAAPEEVEQMAADYLSNVGPTAPDGKQLNVDALRQNFYHIIVNEKVLTFLESKANISEAS